MKRMLSTTTLLAAIVAGYPSGAVAQQAAGNDVQHLSDQNQEPAAAIHLDPPRSRSPQEQRAQPTGEDTLRSESRGSGLASTLYKTTMSVRIEQVPRPVDSEGASRLIGMFAVSSRGEKLGEILAVVRSPTDGLLALVDAGEFSGVGVRPVALPIEPGRIDRDGNLKVPVSREELERLPVFATNSIP